MSTAEYSKMYRKRMAKKRAIDPAFAEKQRAKWREIRAKRRQYYIDYCRQYNPGYYEDNRESIIAYQSEYARRNRELKRKWANKYANSDKGKKQSREQMRFYREILTDAIVSEAMNKHAAVRIKYPKELIEAKRVHIELKREIRKWQ